MILPVTADVRTLWGKLDTFRRAGVHYIGNAVLFAAYNSRKRTKLSPLS